MTSSSLTKETIEVLLPAHYMNKHEGITRQTWNNQRLINYVIGVENKVIFLGASMNARGSKPPMSQKKFDSLVNLAGLFNACKAYKNLGNDYLKSTRTPLP